MKKYYVLPFLVFFIYQWFKATSNNKQTASGYEVSLNDKSDPSLLNTGRSNIVKNTRMVEVYRRGGGCSCHHGNIPKEEDILGTNQPLIVTQLESWWPNMPVNNSVGE